MSYNHKDLKGIVFFLGSCFIFSSLTAQNTIARNSVLLESNLIAMTSLSYNRIIPLSEKVSFALGGGYIIGAGFGYRSHWAKVETSLLSFGPKNIFEAGVLYIFGKEDNSSPGAKLAYRFLEGNGITFTLSVYVLTNIDPPVLPALGIGYTF